MQIKQTLKQTDDRRQAGASCQTNKNQFKQKRKQRQRQLTSIKENDVIFNLRTVRNISNRICKTASEIITKKKFEKLGVV